MTLDRVTVGIAAGRLASILDEQQATLVRTAFSTIVRESEDLACGVKDALVTVGAGAGDKGGIFANL
jgi:N-methylhydantoinase B